MTYKYSGTQKVQLNFFWYLYLIKLTQIAKLSIFTKNIWWDTFV